MDAGDAVCGNRSSYLITLVLRIVFQLFPLACCRKLIRTGNTNISCCTSDWNRARTNGRALNPR